MSEAQESDDNKDQDESGYLNPVTDLILELGESIFDMLN